MRIHVVVDKRGDALHFDFTASADQTKGPANIRPPLVQAACAYCLISLIDPHIYVCSGLLQGFSMTAREGSVLNPRFPAPVNTYNPTIHALVDAIFAALEPRRAGEGARRRQRQPVHHSRRPQHPFGPQLRPVRDRGGRCRRPRHQGRRVRHHGQSEQRADRAGRDHEFEFPTRVLRFDLVPDSGGAGRNRGGLGLRREYLNLADARFSIRSMKHVIPPHGCAGGRDGRTGDIVINPDSEIAKRLPTRYADYPLRQGDVFRLDTPGGGGYGDPFGRDLEKVLADVREGYITGAAAERDYGVVVVATERGLAVDFAATARQRNKGKP